MLTFIDTHAHLNSKQYDLDLEKVITSSKKAGVKKIIVPGFDIFTSLKSIEIAKKYNGYCFGTCGIHPYHANKVYDLFDAREAMESIISANKELIVAVGEVGLDYHLYKDEDAGGKKTQQRELLKIEIELALKYRLPLILHCRSAWDDLLEILSEYKKEGLKGVSHCFEGGKLHLKKIMELGFNIGVNGLVTFNTRIAEVITDAPFNKILLETDAPFLTPAPERGKRNEPKYIRAVAKYVANLKGVNIEEAAKQTTINAESTFKLN